MGGWRRRVASVGAATALIGGGALLGGGVAAASDYPPDDPVATTIVDPAPLRTPTDGGDLANTGSDSSDTLKIAGGVLIAGIGLVVVAAKTRRRPSPA